MDEEVFEKAKEEDLSLDEAEQVKEIMTLFHSLMKWRVDGQVKLALMKTTR